MPTLRVAPFVVVGTPDTRVIAAETLSGKISEAFALFDVVNVAVAAPPNARAPAPGAPASRPAAADYRLDGTVEYRGNGLVDLRFKLIDESDATVIWSRAFEKLFDTDGSGDTERKIIFELANAVAQPFGVIPANDRAKRLGTNVLDPRYCCLLESADALRSFDPAAHARVRAGLERLTALDPNFAAGFSILAALYGREYITGFGARPGDPPPLERALKAARRGIELKPQNARGYHILFAILFFRGEKDAAIAAAEKAIALNPYDVLIKTEFGGRLIYAGEVDRGMAILHDAVGFGAILPSWSHFALFVGHYMRGEMVEARSQASQLTSETYVYGQLARALIARLDGDRAEFDRAKRGDSRASAGLGRRSAQGNRQSDHCAGNRGPPCGGFCRGLNIVSDEGLSGVPWHVGGIKVGYVPSVDVTANFSQSAATSIHRRPERRLVRLFPVSRNLERPPRAHVQSP